VFLGIQLFDK